MRSPLLSTAGALALSAVFSAVGIAQAAAPNPMAGLRDLGRAPATTRVEIGVTLQYHNQAALEQLVDAQVDESSPLYHHFLNQQQFRNYFAPTDRDYGHVVASLQRAGFTILRTYPNRTLVDAAAPARVAERYFSTEIHSIRQPGVGVQYANMRPATIPREIGSLVVGVVGLSNVLTMHADHVFLPPNAPRRAVSNAHFNSAPIFGPDGGYGPLVFETSYNMPSLGSTTGTGRASGVATDGDFLDSDLAGYLSYFQVNRTGPTTTRVLIDGGPPPGNGGGDSVETALDVEQIVSLAPGTALYVYEAKQFQDLMYFVDIYNQVVVDNKVDTLNSSYSQCETAFDTDFPKTAEQIEIQGAAEGITFHASSGDGGTDTYGCGNKVSVGTPVDTPHNVGIGGTTMSVNSNGQETNEVGWSYGTGGGVSVVFKRLPKYQRKVSTMIKGGRNIPDVSFDADPDTGASYFYAGRFQGPIGGTSLSSPIFGASLTLIDQLKGARAGFFNRPLYAAWKKHQYSNGSTVYFRDIISGTIGQYSAGPGYDQMTGIGTMNVLNFEGVVK